MYNRNVPAAVFLDNVLSTDPRRAFTNASGKILNQKKRSKFGRIWKEFNTKYNVKVLQLVFSYPQPVGSVEYPDIFEYSTDQLCLFLGFQHIDSLSSDNVNAGVLANVATGYKYQERRGQCKRLRDSLDDFCQEKKNRKRNNAS